MTRRPVTSSNVASVGYDQPSATLEVEFQNGSVYQYFGVPGSEHRGLVGATSVGSYLAQHIKDSYPYQRIR